MLPSTVSHYRILDVLGSGGNGIVYRAEDEELQRIVALKFLHNEAVTEAARQRLRLEARAVSALNHPNICAIYEVAQDSGQLFIAMEYVDGKPLSKLIRPEGIPTASVLRYGLQIASGLEHAHSRGVIHRDLKPLNVIVTPEGDAKILDFGLALRRDPAELDKETLKTVSEADALKLVGTLPYIAPEQFEGSDASPRTDIWSLGVLLYEIASGARPFQSEAPWGLCTSIVRDAPPALPPHVPPALSSVIHRCLEKEPARRYHSAGELRAALEALKLTTQTAASTLKPARQPGLTLKLVLAGLLIAALAGVGLKRWSAKNSSHPPGTGATPQVKQLALLPIFDTAGESDASSSAAFGNGLMETLTSRLEQVTENHALEIIPVTELRAKGVSNLQQAHEQFGADLGLELSCHRSGDRMRVNYSVVDAATHRQLRGASITASASDAFQLEDQVANSVLNALDLELHPGEAPARVARGTSASSAYDHFLQGRGYLQDFHKAENIESAVVQFNQALALDRNFAPAHAGLGEAFWYKYLSTHDAAWVPRATDECKTAVRLQSVATEGFICLGLVYRGTGQYADSVKQLQQAAALEPTNDDAIRGLAAAYQALHDDSQAEQTYLRAIQTRPQHWQNYNFLGAFYAGRGDFPKAADMFERVVRLAPDNSKGFSNLGVVYLDQDRFEDAVNAFNRSIAIRPNGPAYSNQGGAYFSLRRFDEAAQSYKEAVRLDERDYTLRGNLAEAYYYGGHRDLAAESFKQAVALGEDQLKVNPSDTDLLPLLAGYYSMIGDRPAALKLMDRALQLAPNDSQVLCSAGLMYNKFGDTDKAIFWLHKAVLAGYPITQLRTAPAVDNLQNDPRFKKLFDPQSQGDSKN